jgi:hypothetical protein
VVVVADPETTSTEWRDDTANLVVVGELNRAYAALPFSREFDGVLDESPIELEWSVGLNMPVTSKAFGAGLIGEDVILAGSNWEPGHQNLAFAYNTRAETYTPLPPAPFETEHTQGASDGQSFYLVSGRIAGRQVARLGAPMTEVGRGR